MIPLRKSTASQEVLLGPFLDDTDGKTAETGLTIANTDIKLWKRGGTTESSKNSGGATHIASGRYHATLDDTDTDTTGELIINVAVAGALPVRLVCHVYEAAVFDAWFASGAAGYQVPIWTSASATVNLSGTTVKAVTDSVAATVSDKTGYKLASDGLAAISAWTVAITGNLTGNVTGSVNSVATTVSANVVQWNSGALPTFPTHFGSLLINSSGHLSRVTLVDTTTTNSDMRGTDGAALASVWTSTIAARIDMPLSDIPTAGENADAVWDEDMSGHTTAGTYGGRIVRATNSNVTVQISSNHVAADVHEFQPGVITAADFAAGAIDAAALAADAAAEIAAAVRTNLATELARIDVTIGSRLADASYTAPPTATTVADAVLTRNVSNVETVAGTTTLCTLVLAGVGKALTVGGVLNIYRTNGTTVHATKTLTTDPNADPVTGIS